MKQSKALDFPELNVGLFLGLIIDWEGYFVATSVVKEHINFNGSSIAC